MGGMFSSKIPSAPYIVPYQKKFTEVFEEESRDKLWSFAVLIGVKNLVDIDSKELLISKIIGHVMDLNKSKIFIKREQIIDYVTGSLSRVELVNKFACTSHKSPRQLMDTIEILKMLGWGLEGSVFDGYINHENYPISLAIKFIKLDKKTFNIILNHKEPWYKIGINKGIREIMASFMVNEIIKLKATPSLVYSYWWYLCDNCREIHKIGGTPKSRKRIPITGPCFILISEKMLGDIRPLCKRLNKEDCLIMIFEVIWALHCLQLYWGIAHGDSYVRNIFYTVETPGGYLTFTDLDGTQYFIPKTKYTFYLGDYGFSESPRYFGISGGKMVFSSTRNLETGALNPPLPSPYDNQKYQSEKRKSLFFFLLDLGGKVNEEVQNEVIYPMIDAYKKREVDYLSILKKYLWPYFKTKPVGQSEIASYSVLNSPTKDFDLLYKSIAQSISDF